MKKIVTSLAILFSITANLFAQNASFVWAKQMGGIGEDSGQGVTIDDNGNIYAIGSFKDTVDFDPSPTVNNLISNGDSDVFIQKYDSSGNLTWVKQIGGIGEDKGEAIVVDSNGDIYIIGNFSDTVDFDPNAGTHNLISTGATFNGITNTFIQKLDPSGNLLWVKQIDGVVAVGGISGDRMIALDNSGNLYATGRFTDTVDFDPGLGVHNLSSSGSNIFDLFLLKLDPSGNFIWAKQTAKGTGSSESLSINIDFEGNLYTTGFFIGTKDFDPGSGTFNFSSGGPGTFDMFIQKLDSLGNFIWAKQVTGNGRSDGFSIVTDDDGNAYITGFFYGTKDFDPGSGTTNLTNGGFFGFPDFFVQKLDPLGNLLWVKQVQGTGAKGGSSVALDTNGNVYATGFFSGTVDFDPGLGTSNLTSNGGNDIFILKLDSLGKFLWSKQMGGTSSDLGESITILPNGDIYTIGSFEGMVDFDPDGGVTNFNSKGSADIFIQKLRNFCFIDDSINVSGTTLTANQSGATYQWLDCSNGFAAISGATNQSFSPTMTGDYAVVISNGGCIDTSDCKSFCFVDDSISVSGTTLTANQSGATYQWLDCSNGFVAISGATGQSFSPTMAGNYAVVIDNGGCVDTSDCNSPCFTDDSISVSGTTLTANQSGAIYQWLDCSNGFVAISGATSQSFSPTMTGDYAVVIDNGGCIDTSDCKNFCFIDDSISVSGTTLTANQSGAIYQWLDCSNGFVAISGATSQSFSPTMTGDYAVVIDNGGCIDTSDCKNFCFIDDSISVSGTTLTANQSGATYQWLDCSNGFVAISGATSQSFSPTMTGDYAVVIDNGGCIDTSVCENILITGLNDLSVAEDLVIFPSPSMDGIFKFTYSKEIERIELFDLTGRAMDIVVDLKTGRINASKLNSGTYILRFSTRSTRFMRKIVIN